MCGAMSLADAQQMVVLAAFVWAVAWGSRQVIRFVRS